MRPRNFLLAAFLFLASARAALAFSLSDFETPEGIAVDPDDRSYFVSNINGGPTEKDANGYISKIASNGSIVIQKYIGGGKGGLVLHAPKGMVVLGRRLYVADIDTVKIFDKK